MGSSFSAIGQRSIRTLSWPVWIVTLALFFGGLIGGLTNFLLLNGFWPWPMPPLAFRFLAGAAAAYVVGSFLTLIHARWVEAELLMLTVLAYGFPLVGAILIDQYLIDWTKPIAWLFVIIVAFAASIAVIYLWRKRGAAQAESAGPLQPSTHLFLISLAALAGLVGLIVFIAPKSAGFVWPWATLTAWKRLDSRLIASMLLTIATGAFYTRWRNDRGAVQVIVGMLWAYCLVAGIGITLHALATPDFVRPDVTYLIIFAVIVVTSIVIFLREQQTTA